MDVKTTTESIMRQEKTEEREREAEDRAVGTIYF